MIGLNIWDFVFGETNAMMGNDDRRFGAADLAAGAEERRS